MKIAKDQENPAALVGEGIGFQRIRRITGYLVGTIDRWNNAERDANMPRSMCKFAGLGIWKKLEQIAV